MAVLFDDGSTEGAAANVHALAELVGASTGAASVMVDDTALGATDPPHTRGSTRPDTSVPHIEQSEPPPHDAAVDDEPTWLADAMDRLQETEPVADDLPRGSAPPVPTHGTQSPPTTILEITYASDAHQDAPSHADDAGAAPVDTSLRRPSTGGTPPADTLSPAHAGSELDQIVAHLRAIEALVHRLRSKPTERSRRAPTVSVRQLEQGMRNRRR